MDLVLRLTDSDELPRDNSWMIVERNDGQVLAVVDRNISDAELCCMWGLINPPEAQHDPPAQQSA